MARYRGPIHKLSRREEVNLTGKASESLKRRLGVPPGGGRPRRMSDYAVRLRAKQRVKRQYGIMEKQFRRLFEEARRHHGLPGENLLALLERRLDNVVYRLSFARTRAMARQLVGHGHVLVNGKRVTVPSYTVQEGDMITLEDEAWNMPLVQQELQQGRSLPSWLTREDRIGRVIGTPRREEIDPDIREDLIVEFYSR